MREQQGRCKHLCSTEDGDGVGLFAWCGEVALAGTAAGQLGLYVFLRKLHAWRHALDNTPHAFAVRFAEGRHFEKTAE